MEEELSNTGSERERERDRTAAFISILLVDCLYWYYQT